jgi:pyridoxamine 5'-phosphate oxidase
MAGQSRPLAPTGAYIDRVADPFTIPDMQLADLRREYAQATLDVADVAADPVTQFKRWFADAERAELLEPNAMTLATCTPSGEPSARVVLLKEVDASGFVFFTDYRSFKSRELEANPRAALCVLWKEIERQVRVSGRVERTSAEESTAYFDSRPLGSRYGAWASVQSAVIPDRAWLDAALRDAERRFPGAPPRPDHWGGFRVIPGEVEFWQGRPSRLHDRVRFRRASGEWVIERLSP